MPALQSAIHNILHLFFPHVCVGCGSDILDQSHYLCLKCITNLPSTNFFNQHGNPVEKTFYGRLAVKAGGAAYFFTENSIIENLVYELKYKGNKEIGYYLGKLIGNLLQETNWIADVDIMVPLPLNVKREKRRGYNQATALCKGIASVINKPFLDKAVIRTVYTETQTQKGRVTRWQNMQNVFAVAEPTLIQDKHILLVDDVITTGASLEACGAEILKVSGTSLSIATLAYTPDI